MRRILFAVTLVVCLLLCGCTGEGGINQDPLGKYANKVEDYKEQIEAGMAELEEELEQVQDTVNEVRRGMSGE